VDTFTEKASWDGSEWTNMFTSFPFLLGLSVLVVALAIGTRALALVRGRSYVTPEDVKELAPTVLRHRLVLTYEAEAEGATVEEITERILLAVEVP